MIVECILFLTVVVGIPFTTVLMGTYIYYRIEMQETPATNL